MGEKGSGRVEHSPNFTNLTILTNLSNLTPAKLVLGECNGREGVRMGNLLDKLDDLDNLDDLDTLDKASLVSGCDAIVPVSAHHLQADCGRSRSRRIRP
jgi:hypothetical protein